METLTNSGANWSKGFTLIELLIVVAIIAILATIAIINLVEAQTRSKVSRAKTDLRAYSMALESYMVDNNAYPYPGTAVWHGKDMLSNVFELTTPIGYIASVDAGDIFKPSWDPLEGNEPPDWRASYHYNNYAGWFGEHCARIDSAYGLLNGYSLICVGPDRDYNGSAMAPYLIEQNKQQMEIDLIYDPTNGTSSKGDMIRWTGQPAIYGSL